MTDPASPSPSPSLPAGFRLDGRTALVTGGAGLLGIEHAAALLEAGARVVVTDIREEALARARGRLLAAIPEGVPEGGLRTERLDVASPQDVARVAAALAGSGWEVDILVNNAAIDPKVTAASGLEEASRLEHFPMEMWDQQIAVGLTGAFLCARSFGAAMAARGRGVILNIASDLSVIAPDQRLYRDEALPEDRQPVKPVTYSVIKTGLVGLTRYLATYWADRGVRVNALSPGGVFIGQAAAFVDRLEARIPMGRMATAGEYRATVQYLCSDASAYMTGQNIVVDGGRSVW